MDRRTKVQHTKPRGGSFVCVCECVCVHVRLIKRKLSRGVFRTFQTFNGRDQSSGMGHVEVGEVAGTPGVLKPEAVQWPLEVWPHHTPFI